MRICRFIWKNKQKYGIIVNNKIWDFMDEINSTKDHLYAMDFICFFNNNIKLIKQKINDNSMENLIDFDRELLLAPLLYPSKIICLGLNYLDHAKETGTKLPDRPMLFTKASSSIIGPNDQIVIPTLKKDGKYVPIKFIDYEAELAVIVGKQMKKINVDEVNNYIFGYTILNDVSARIEQKKDKQFFRSKSFDTFAPIGPWIVSQDEITDPMNLKIQSFVNDELRQNSNTSNMNFNVYEILSFISEGITLYPGDIIGTGTPAGVGVGMNPPQSMKNGDIVKIKIEKIGELVNKIA